MPNPYFNFKQFTVWHDRCAMKVGTDGVLLGAWTDIQNAQKILDVGAGSGLVALMLAQRNNIAIIDSIEIDENAAMQATGNFHSSPFSNIPNCIHQSLQEYSAQCGIRYDLIVSNPPFFTRSLKSPDSRRSMARHTDSLLIEDFIEISARLLSENGRISFIFPYDEKDYLFSLAINSGLSVSRATYVCPVPSAKFKRILIELSVRKTPPLFSELTIETERHVYSPEFTKLVKDFYIKL